MAFYDTLFFQCFLKLILCFSDYLGSLQMTLSLSKFSVRTITCKMPCKGANVEMTFKVSFFFCHCINTADLEGFYKMAAILPVVYVAQWTFSLLQGKYLPLRISL